METKEGAHSRWLWGSRMVAELCGGPEKVVQGFLGEMTAVGNFSTAGDFSPISQQERQEAEGKMGRR